MRKSNELTCRRCGESKPPIAFPVRPRMRSGRGSWCMECALARTREWRAANRDEILAARRAQYQRDRVAILASKAAWYAARRRQAGGGAR